MLIIFIKITFLGGFYFIKGAWGTVKFFKNKAGLKGNSFYFGGLLVIVIFKLTVIGFCM